MSSFNLWTKELLFSSLWCALALGSTKFLSLKRWNESRNPMTCQRKNNKSLNVMLWCVWWSPAAISPKDGWHYVENERERKRPRCYTVVEGEPAAERWALKRIPVKKRSLRKSPLKEELLWKITECFMKNIFEMKLLFLFYYYLELYFYFFLVSSLLPFFFCIIALQKENNSKFSQEMSRKPVSLENAHEHQPRSALFHYRSDRIGSKKMKNSWNPQDWKEEMLENEKEGLNLRSWILFQNIIMLSFYYYWFSCNPRALFLIWDYDTIIMNFLRCVS